MYSVVSIYTRSTHECAFSTVFQKLQIFEEYLQNLSCVEVGRIQNTRSSTDLVPWIVLLGNKRLAFFWAVLGTRSWSRREEQHPRDSSSRSDAIRI